MYSRPNIFVITQDFQELGHVFIYRQIIAMKRFRPVVVTWKRINSDKFPYDAVETLNYPRQFWKKVNLIVQPTLKLNIVDYLKKRGIRRIVEKYKPAIIHIHFGWMASEYLKNYHTNTTPLVVTFHGFDIMVLPGDRNRLKDLREIVFRRADKLIFVSEFLRAQAIELGCPEDKTVVNYLGAPISNHASKRENGDHLRAICVARFVPCKGHRYLLKSIRKVVNQGISIRLDLIGDGPLRDRISWDIERLGLVNIVNCLGIMDNNEVFKKMQASDIYIHHAVTAADGQTEALGISIAEAMSCGLPVVATRSGGIPELVLDDITGILVEERNVEEMAKAIVNLSKNALKRREMGALGKSRIQSCFSVASGTDALERIYDSLLWEQDSEAKL